MIRRMLLSILASLPFGMVSYAAHSALQDTHDHEAVGSLKEELRLKRKLIFETGSMATSVDEAYERFRLQRGLSDGIEAENQFLHLIGKMEERGLLQKEGEFLLASAPSQH